MARFQHRTISLQDSLPGLYLKIVVIVTIKQFRSLVPMVVVYFSAHSTAHLHQCTKSFSILTSIMGVHINTQPCTHKVNTSITHHSPHTPDPTPIQPTNPTYTPNHHTTHQTTDSTTENPSIYVYTTPHPQLPN